MLDDFEQKDAAVQTDITLRDDRAYETLLIQKIDRRLLPILGALYAISLVDRVNVCLLTSLWRSSLLYRYLTRELRA